MSFSVHLFAQGFSSKVILFNQTSHSLTEVSDIRVLIDHQRVERRETHRTHTHTHTNFDLATGVKSSAVAGAVHFHLRVISKTQICFHFEFDDWFAMTKQMVWHLFG